MLDVEEMEVLALRKKLEELEKRNKELLEIIHVNGLGDEIEEDRPVSPEEEICILGIDTILEAIQNKCEDPNDIKNFDILHKNLRMIRGAATDIKKVKKHSKAELLELVKKKDA